MRLKCHSKDPLGANGNGFESHLVGGGKRGVEVSLVGKMRGEGRVKTALDASPSPFYTAEYPENISFR